MIHNLISFIAKYEYARSLFDIRASRRFLELGYDQSAELFQSLANTEINHSQRFSELLPNATVVPSRKYFFSKPDLAYYNGAHLDGLSKNKIWSRFLFKNKSAGEYELVDTIAFCAAAEFLEQWGYKLISFLPYVGRLAFAIGLEEQNAEVRLKEHFYQLTNRENNQILKYWYVRSVQAMIILILTGNR